MLGYSKHIIFFVSVLCVTSASAGESWDCNFKSISGSAKGLPGSAKIHINGDILNWNVLVARVPLQPDKGATWTAFRNRLLEDNDVGIVAITSEARMDSHVGSLVGATIITVQKSNGEFRMGSVMVDGEHDLLAGHCELEAASSSP